MKVSGLRPAGVEQPISFEVRSGEILGIAGLLGLRSQRAAARDLRRGRLDVGTIEIDGKELRRGDPRRAVRAGLGLLTEDRKRLGLLLELTIRENASIADLDELSNFTLVDRKQERGIVDKYLGGLRLRAGVVGAAGVVAVGRQPAEGPARALARDEGEGPAVRRADEGRRRRGQGGDLQGHRRPRRRGARRHRRLLLPARGARARRPRARHARRLRRGRAVRGGSDGRGRAAAREPRRVRARRNPRTSEETGA